MDPISQARFDQLRKADPNTWTDDDRDFMRGRRSYMPEDEAKALGLTGKAPSEPVAEKPMSKEEYDTLKPAEQPAAPGEGPVNTLKKGKK